MRICASHPHTAGLVSVSVKYFLWFLYKASPGELHMTAVYLMAVLQGRFYNQIYFQINPNKEIRQFTATLQGLFLK